jgi:hypothetical protein
MLQQPPEQSLQATDHSTNARSEAGDALEPWGWPGQTGQDRIKDPGTSEVLQPRWCCAGDRRGSV